MTLALNILGRKVKDSEELEVNVSSGCYVAVWGDVRDDLERSVKAGWGREHIYICAERCFL